MNNKIPYLIKSSEKQTRKTFLQTKNQSEETTLLHLIKDTTHYRYILHFIVTVIL